MAAATTLLAAGQSTIAQTGTTLEDALADFPSGVELRPKGQRVFPAL
jgi:hypothetical protein